MERVHAFALGPDSPQTSPNRGEDTGNFSNLKQGRRPESRGTDSSCPTGQADYHSRPRTETFLPLSITVNV